MKSTRAIEKDEQILNDYGTLPRSDVLRRYGYITPGYAKYDVVELSHQSIVEVVQEYRALSGHLLTARVSEIYTTPRSLANTGSDRLLEERV